MYYLTQLPPKMLAPFVEWNINGVGPYLSEMRLVFFHLLFISARISSAEVAYTVPWFERYDHYENWCPFTFEHERVGVHLYMYIYSFFSTGTLQVRHQNQYHLNGYLK
jgi:hypothetical protein